MILIIGGTSEGEEIYERLKDKYELYLSVATESGKKLYASKAVSYTHLTLPTNREV